MRGRDYKPNYPDAYFHAFNRGVNKNLIFLDEQDYQNFTYRAKILLGFMPLPKRTPLGGMRLSVLPRGMVEVLSYCLMPNHFHFLVKQRDVNGMQFFIQRLCTSYASYFNKKYDRVGHIFQDAFKCKNVLDDAYLTHLSAYIHLNPQHPFSWKHSSLPQYLGDIRDSFVNHSMIMDIHKLTYAKYKEFLRKKFDESILEGADLLFDD